MSDQISLAGAMQLFDTEVQVRYQNDRRLQDTIEERHGTTGTTLNVPVSDLIEMQSSNFAPTDIPVTNVVETNRQVQTTDFRLKTVIGGGEKTLFNYDKIVIHAKLHAKAAARMDDYIKINAIFGDPNVSTIYTVAANVGANVGVNEGKMAQALSYLESQGVDVQDYSVSMWMPARMKKSMYDDDKVVSFFYNAVKPLTDNRIVSYLGTDIRAIGENGINRIPHTSGGGTDTYLVPVVHKDAIVQSYNRDIRTSVTWLQHQDRWELLTIMTSGSLIIQYNGIALLTAQITTGA